MVVFMLRKFNIFRIEQYNIIKVGSAVTKNFPEGNCVIAGNLAKLIKRMGE